jgi:UDP-N-acetylmuramate--alanine ligase
MAGLARLFRQKGMQVSGSDLSSNRLTKELNMLGVSVTHGHHRRNIPEEVKWAVRTPAIQASNPELECLRSRHLPVYARGEVLATVANARHSVAVAGAHGKTTTSAMLLHLLRTCGVEAGYAIGGETAFPGRVADEGNPEAPFVVEADESDGTLMQYRPQVGVITHLEWDHVERFPTEASLCACYRRFALQSRTVWIREDDPLSLQVCRDHARLRRAGVSEQADLRMLDVVSSPEGVGFRFRVGEGETLTCRVPLPGEHNAWNALLSIGAGMDLGIEPQAAAAALADYAGVGRRFQRADHRGIQLIQDYAHHPTELRAVLSSVRALRPGRIWVVFQPHRFSRTRHLLREFADALAEVDQLALLPVYGAFERPEQGADSKELAECCRPCHPEVRVWEDREELLDAWMGQLERDDVLLLAGAGDIGSLWESVLAR